MFDNKFTPQQFDLNSKIIIKNGKDASHYIRNREELITYKLHLKRAKYYYKKGALVDAYRYYGMAKAISVNILWYEAEAHCLMAIGTIYTIWEKFDVAYKNYMQCLNIALDKSLYNILSLIYFRLSDYYAKISQPKLSIAYSEKAIYSIKKSTILG